MTVIKGWAFVSIKEADATDTATLDEIYSCEEFKANCMYQPDVPESLFVAESESLTPYLHSQYVIIFAGKPIGTVYAYGRDPRDGHTFIAAYVEPKKLYEWISAGGEAVAILADHLFETVDALKEIRFEVYEHSIASLNTLRGLELDEVEVVNENTTRIHNGAVSKLFVFTLTRDNFVMRLSAALKKSRSYFTRSKT